MKSPKFRSTIGCTAGFLLLASGVAPAQPAHEISGERIRAHVRFLASDLLEGRGVGERGGRLAEEYIAAALAASGVKPAGENGTYFQAVPLVGVTTIGDESRLEISRGGGERLALQWQSDFVGSTQRQQTSVDLSAGLVFAGHGIQAPEQNWDDFKGIDVKGKILVVFTNEPQPENPEVFKGKALTYYGRWTYKFEQAARMGALGCLIIHTTATAGYGWEVVRNSWGKEDPQVGLDPAQPALAFAGWVTEAAGNKLLSLAGHSVAALLKAADSRDFQPIELGLKLDGRIRSRIRKVETRNVAGMVPGSDPELSREAVVFTAHWDHLGVSTPVNGDGIYNGAIDNATGCGMVLETARAWAALERKPRRSAVFLFVTAEESGLRGSEFYTRKPLVAPGRTALNINYDAVYPWGLSRDLVVMGADRITAGEVIEDAAKRFRFELQSDQRPEQGSFYRSDHFMMARAGIPAINIKSGSRIYGKSDDFAAQMFREYNTGHYHQPSDEYRAEWDFSGLEQIARFGSVIGATVANAQALPNWREGDEFKAARDASLKPAGNP